MSNCELVVDWQKLILEEIANKQIKRRSVAQTYRYMLEEQKAKGTAYDWAKVNAAIIARWSVSALTWIKEAAWSGRCLESVTL